jgi:twinkle protein
VVFPFFEMVWDEEGKVWRQGPCVLVKYRDIEDKAYQRTGPKLSEGGRTVLFGMPLVPAAGRDLVVTEGEFDAMALWQMGLPAVSIPFGAQPAKEGELSESHRRWLEECHAWMERFDCVYLAFDHDKAGQAGARSVAPRVGIERAKILLMPGGYKDGNEALQMGVSEREIAKALRDARGFDPEELKTPMDLLEEIAGEMFPERMGVPSGDELPWTLPFRLRRGEVTVVHGYNVHGKTVLLSYVLAWLAAVKGRRSLIASLEVPGRKLLRNILRQVFGRPRAADEKELRRWVEWQTQFFWVYAHVGQADLKRVLEVWRYGARKYGIEYFMLDSLMMLAGLEGEDYDGQKEVMNQLLELIWNSDMECMSSYVNSMQAE